MSNSLNRRLYSLANANRRVYGGAHWRKVCRRLWGDYKRTRDYNRKVTR